MLSEAERNLKEKFSPIAFERFRIALAAGEFVVAAISESADLREHQQIVGEKDAHVLAAAIEVGARYIITLDRPLIAGVNSIALPVVATTPGDFIQGPLTSHPEFHQFRRS